ncbi:uncharacterized protein LOC141647996 [Silene latifolia]|uniref:uncharacterized protein LOC141647996 n=1 Tax=Silene latifolia TaxID=37657 RepID=UPI003D7765BE
MASVSVTKLSKEDHAAVKSLINGAVGKATFDASLPQGQSITQGLMWNNNRHQKNLVLIDQHIWSGELTRAYPNPLVYSRQGQPSIFILEGPNGSKGGVVYADGIENTDRQWLLAFDGTADKVYVEAGRRSPTKWEEVEDKLNESGSQSESVDPEYGGKAYAEIQRAQGRSLVFVWFSN